MSVGPSHNSYFKVLYFQDFLVRASQSSSFNSFMTEVPIIEKPSHWFALQINEWFQKNRDLRHERFEKRFTKRAMITSFRLIPCEKPSTSKTAKKMNLLVSFSQSSDFKALYKRSNDQLLSRSTSTNRCVNDFEVIAWSLGCVAKKFVLDHNRYNPTVYYRGYV